MQRFEDIDDSLSNISTVSDDSEPDSGYDHSNWVSKLAALSEIEESDYEVVPRLNWAEVYNSGEDQALHRGASVSSLLSNDNQDVESVSNPNEMISRAEWDRILRSEPRPLDASLVRNLSSGTTTTTTTPSGDTLKGREKQDIAGAAATDSSAKHQQRHHHHHRSSTPTNNQSSILRSSRDPTTTSTRTVTDKERTGSWLSNIFRKNTTLSQHATTSSDMQQQPGPSTDTNTNNPTPLLEPCSNVANDDNHAVGESDAITNCDRVLSEQQVKHTVYSC